MCMFKIENIYYNEVLKMPAKKIPDKLTDSEKKKQKQANKAKANPNLAKAKAVKNLERRYNRCQEKRPDKMVVVEEEED